MKEAGGEKMRERSGLAEHPFGTLKHRAGWSHFLVCGFEKIGGEWALMATCYNFDRVLNIIGFDAFKEYCQVICVKLTKGQLDSFQAVISRE